MEHSTIGAERATAVGIAPGSVKIDGLREPAHARAAVVAGAEMVGFIFAPARRRVTVEEARACLTAARAAADGRAVRGVGVFVDASVAEMNTIADAAGLDLLQLHGEEPPEMLAELERPVVKVFRPKAGWEGRRLEAEFRRYRGVGNEPVAFLVDGYSPTAAGGEGVRADWDLVAKVSRTSAVVLAGGLDAGNVAEAIGRVRPVAVDVSSGVETEGRKDEAKIAAFVAAAKRAFRASAGS